MNNSKETSPSRRLEMSDGSFQVNYVSSSRPNDRAAPNPLAVPSSSGVAVIHHYPPRGSGNGKNIKRSEKGPSSRDPDGSSFVLDQSAINPTPGTSPGFRRGGGGGHELGANRAAISRTSEGRPGGLYDTTQSTCSCLKTLQEQFSKGQYAGCIELGVHFLTQAPQATKLEDLVEALQYIGTSMVSQCELEKARNAFAMQLQAIQASRWGYDEHCGPSRMKKKWILRYHRNMAVLEEADGHREEAIRAAVEQWRIEAELYGPESLRCVRTYAWIADLRLSLGQSEKAFTMLEHASRLLEAADAKSTDPTTWVRVQRSIAELLVASGKPEECMTAAAHLQQVVLVLQEQLTKIEEDEVKLANTPSPARPLTSSSSDAAGSNSSPPKDALAATKTFKQGEKLRADGEDAKYHLSELARNKEGRFIEYGGALVQYATAFLLTAGGGGDTSNTSSLGQCPAKATEAALSLLEEADGIFQAVLPRFDILAVRTRLKLVQLQFDMGHIPLKSLIDRMCEVQEALTQEEVRGTKHLQALVEVREALGDAFAQGKFNPQANESYEKALGLARQLFAPDHEVCAVLQHKLSESCISCSRYEDAHHMLLELLQWAKDCPRDRKPPVALFAIFHSLGNVMRLSEKFTEALSFYQQAMDQPEGQELPTKAKILGSMATAHQTTGQLPEAVSLFQEALRVKIQSYGKIHLEVASTLQQLSTLYMAMAQLMSTTTTTAAEQEKDSRPNPAFLKDSISCAERAMDIFHRLAASTSTKSSSTGATHLAASTAGSSISAQASLGFPNKKGDRSTRGSTTGSSGVGGFTGTNTTISGSVQVAEQSAVMLSQTQQLGTDHPIYLQCAKIKAQGVRLQKAENQRKIRASNSSTGGIRSRNHKMGRSPSK